MLEITDDVDACTGVAVAGDSRADAAWEAPRTLAGQLLVIEDVADLRVLLKTALASFGLPVVEVADGRVAAGMVGMVAPPRLVIVDRMLPFVSGDELIASIRSDERWRNVPILAMSAIARAEDIASVLALGANAYLPKPFRYQTMRDTVAQMLGVRAP